MAIKQVSATWNNILVNDAIDFPALGLVFCLDTVHLLFAVVSVALDK